MEWKFNLPRCFRSKSLGFGRLKESWRALTNVVKISLTNHEEAKKQYETLFLFAVQMSRPYPRSESHFQTEVLEGDQHRLQDHLEDF
jgi:hypothetical protein